MNMLENAWQNVRYTLRGLRAKPGFTTAVVLTLGLGIGANAAMFGIVDRLMFRTPKYLHDPGRVHRVYLYQTISGKEIVDNELSYRQYADFARWTTRFAAAAVSGQRTLAVGTGVDASETEVAFVSASFFRFFDASPALGRYFTESEDVVPAGATVAVLSYGFWQTRYGGSTAVLGQPVLKLNSPPLMRGSPPAMRDSPPSTRQPVLCRYESLTHKRVGPPPKRYSLPPKRYSLPPKRYSLPPKRYSLPPKRYSLPAKRYSLPAKRESPTQKRQSSPPKCLGPPETCASLPRMRGLLPCMWEALPRMRTSLPFAGTLRPSKRASPPG